jgi:preprotein translocase subunit SecA
VNGTIAGRKSLRRVPNWVSRFRSRSAVAPLIDVIRELTAELSRLPVTRLREMCADFRLQLAANSDVAGLDLLAGSLALITESICRGSGVRLYDQQLIAAIGLCQGHIVQMQTGEGKTFAAIAAGASLAMSGRGVHVATPNSYLAERDSQLAQRCLEPLQMTIGLLPERSGGDEKRVAYDCDITYGTGHEFGFDYLRDQLTIRPLRRERPGKRLLHELSLERPPRRATLQRGLSHIIVDEADSVMLDDACSPLVLSLAPPAMAQDAAAHHAAHRLADELNPGEHFEVHAATGMVQLTTAGTIRCHADDVDIPVSVLMRPWGDYVRQALRARLLFRRDVHYVVCDDEVRIVDASTGRIYEDRSWQEGLHQAIEAREGLPVTAETVAAARITRQRFFRQYEHLCGLTGTAVGCESELKQVYQLGVVEIPLRTPSAAQRLPTRYFATAAAKWTAIATDTAARFLTGQPVLVGTQSIEDSAIVSQLLTARSVPHELLNGRQDAREADLVAAAGRRNAITIATNLAGRGTDITVDDDVKSLGGLHVIVGECQLSRRMDRQLIGRAARQGAPGSSQMFVSAEDTLLRLFGAWLAEVIRRQADPSGEAMADYSAQLRRIQGAAERQQVLGRLTLLEHDTSRESLLSHLR